MDTSHAEELKRIDKQYDRYVLLIRLGWLALFLILAVVIYRWWYPYQAFDSHIWKTTDPNKSDTRLGMAYDLIASKMLIGKTKEEVIGLLGKPDDTDKFLDIHHTWHIGRGQTFFFFSKCTGYHP